MLALLMCGGKGERLKAGEKPLFKVCGIRLIDHGLRALSSQKLIAVTSPYTPNTEEYVRNLGIRVFRANGRGFIEDYTEAIKQLSLKGPVLIVCSDLVYFRDGIIEEIVSHYKKCGKKALKAVKDNEAVGINIIMAEEESEQEEEIYIVEDVININTIEDAEKAEKLWIMRKKG
ncbi:MAG: NTP transferase domain-containing protein [Archaeoglobaceae archaeon]|nr:NTP transferase domain-containing protein [Archaeoglobaceae archaeon]MDW8118774.1 NTP transferase domain-containing protein [Archaeoglobaceae archaeon]